MAGIDFGAVLKWLRRRFRRATSNELIIQEWGLLEDLWKDRKSAKPDLDPAIVEIIDATFAARRELGDARGWADFNEAERRVGSLLTQAQLKSEFATLLGLAAARALPSLARHAADQVVFDDPAKEAEQRIAYKSLLGALQSDFIDVRFRRRLRSEVAARLFRYGLVLLAIAIFFPLYLVRKVFEPVAVPNAAAVPTVANVIDQGFYLLAVVGTFGVLGAYFSRAIAFNNRSATLTFDEVMQSYIGRLLRIRMLYGLIGALIFYVLLRAGLIGGAVFPDFGKLSVAAVPASPNTPPPTRLHPAALTVLAPTAEFAKLVIWSFIAGFSERLVPEAITRTEARASGDAD